MVNKTQKLKSTEWYSIISNFNSIDYKNKIIIEHFDKNLILRKNCLIYFYRYLIIIESII